MKNWRDFPPQIHGKSHFRQLERIITFLIWTTKNFTDKTTWNGSAHTPTHRPLLCLPNLLVEYKSLTYRKLRIFVRSNLTSHFLATNCLSTASIQHTGRQVQLNGVLSPTSRTSAPPMDIQNAPPRAARADFGMWRTATTHTAHESGISVRLFDEERYRGPHSRSSWEVEGHFFCIDRRKTGNYHNYYDETHTSISSVFFESIRICTAYCCRQSWRNSFCRHTDRQQHNGSQS